MQVINEPMSLKQNQKQKPNMLQEVTHTIISLSDIWNEYQPEPVSSRQNMAENVLGLVLLLLDHIAQIFKDQS